MFQFRRFPSYTYLIQYMMLDRYIKRIAPFGNLRIKTCLQFPAAYRSLPRPSSAPNAKAFALRPYSLDLFSRFKNSSLFENYSFLVLV